MWLFRFVAGEKECVGLSWVEGLGRHEYNGIEFPVDWNNWIFGERSTVEEVGELPQVVNQSGQIVLIAGHVGCDTEVYNTLSLGEGT